MNNTNIPILVVIKDNVVDYIKICKDGPDLEKNFLDKCRELVTNFDKYDQEDIEFILDEGYETIGNGSICMTYPHDYSE